jgi:glycosyltransferase involved in cell wall biosynthesis
MFALVTNADQPIIGGATRVVAALYVTPTNAERLMATVSALRAEGIHVVAGGPSAQTLSLFREVGCEGIVTTDAADTINSAWDQHRSPVLVVGDAITVPRNFLGRALQMIADDLRVASVSFLSNDAGFLSLAVGNETTPRPPDGNEAESVTRQLRQLGPRGLPTPIPAPAGAAVLVAPSALGVLGDLQPGPRGELPGIWADFSARARSRGLMHVLDDLTFYVRYRAPGNSPYQIGSDDLHPDERHWFQTLHPNEAEFIDYESASLTSPLALAHGLALTKVLGLRIAVDGSYLGPSETGTQVSILRTIESLSRRSDVREVIVALQHDIPPYAAPILSLPKVVPRVVDFETFEGLPHCDIAHRPVQPDQWFSVDRWKDVANRVVVTVLDLIGYRNGAYHADAEEWLAYREAVRKGAEAADAVVVISDDVKLQIETERFRVDPQRLHVIPFGTEHLRGDEAVEIPRELEAQGVVEGQFILCLGNDYTHKNRDLAIAVLANLRKRGHPHALIMAGPTVPHGSSRDNEAAALLHEGAAVRSDVYLLGELPSTERNWLMRHADLVLYPSSAEGFGFVPYEAARFGTPSIYTRFGPLAELAPDIPVSALDWSPEALASAAHVLLSDSAQARLQVESLLKAGSKYTWAATAERLTEMYRNAVAIPTR